jgi:hypothetical protein
MVVGREGSKQPTSRNYTPNTRPVRRFDVLLSSWVLHLGCGRGFSAQLHPHQIRTFDNCTSRQIFCPSLPSQLTSRSIGLEQCLWRLEGWLTSTVKNVMEGFGCDDHWHDVLTSTSGVTISKRETHPGPNSNPFFPSGSDDNQRIIPCTNPRSEYASGRSLQMLGKVAVETGAASERDLSSFMCTRGDP